MAEGKALVEDTFWESDLEEIEGQFLKKGEKIDDLPPYINEAAVPTQGSVLLNRAQKIDIPTPSFWKRLIPKLF